MERMRLVRAFVIACGFCCAFEATAGDAQAVKLVYAFPHLHFDRPVDLQDPGDGQGQLFVVEQTGRILTFRNNFATTSRDVFLDIRDRVAGTNLEEGLLGLAFHPQYKQNGFFFVYYTAANPRRSVISRFQRRSSHRADKNSELIILTIEQPYSNHNGGQLAFGPDGYLYIATGDGGSAGDPHGYAQDRSRLLGKILRINVDDKPAGRHYSIPPSNPFARNTEGYREEIYAYGFRNPWRFSFDSYTGFLWAADVGQDRVEEIDIVKYGQNYGWNIMEGSLCFNPMHNCNKTGLTPPVAEYTHDLGASIIGGPVYHGQHVPWLRGHYLFADFVSHRIWAMPTQGKNQFVPRQIAQPPQGISSFGTDYKGEVYIVGYEGTIYKLRPSQFLPRMKIQ